MLKSTNETVLHCYPGLVALVTAKWNDEKNIMAAGWHSYMSYAPPIYGVAVGKERHTHHLIAKSKQFAIQFVPAKLAHYIETAGGFSGRDVDKFERLNIAYQQGETIDCPILSESYAVYECQVKDILPYGDHDWIVGDITKFHHDEVAFDGMLPNLEKVQLPIYLGQSQYIIANHETKLTRIEK
ncbi:flavin reductase family protein [Anaerobacillus sp. MEB173]|uniref:flavin reductase family protein n=1 Tax=Anaerobacillus sp. MEB173 TaxID=3383345 RepID=UPI003F8DA9CB